MSFTEQLRMILNERRKRMHQKLHDTGRRAAQRAELIKSGGHTGRHVNKVAPESKEKGKGDHKKGDEVQGATVTTTTAATSTTGEKGRQTKPFGDKEEQHDDLQDETSSCVITNPR